MRTLTLDPMVGSMKPAVTGNDGKRALSGEPE
jgi:hypothetical protein